MLNMLHIIVTFVDDITYVTNFEDPITSILISRFLLNLREVDTSGSESLLQSRPSFIRSHPMAPGSAHSFITPLGAPLDHGFTLSPRGESDVSDLNSIDPAEHGDPDEARVESVENGSLHITPQAGPSRWINSSGPMPRSYELS
ncbi:hypothetical protein A0H81_07303 [Grifola frondosa]|uniref:Uncharacterized protein n=1 Tax=Grifola frondosa TaxID=5627 RepID=A0A1C7MA03_GRIFR|nr:hypothetical protein A0H81_07303 [Grifola frondosa]